MKQKVLGRSDIQVSAACLGTMYFGTKVSQNNAFEVLDAFVDRGGNFIDTANNYSYWVGGTGEESELLLGRWMQLRNNREKTILATKVGCMPSNRTVSSSPLEGLRAQTIIDGCENSLRRLQTDYVDLFYIHADLQEYPLEERWEALYQLEKAGKIRHKGCSNYEADRLALSEKVGQEIASTGSTAFQQKMSYLRPVTVKPESNLRFVDEDILNYVETHQISLLTYSVLISGAFERSYEDLDPSYHSEENRSKFEFVQEQAKAEGLTPSQWVLKWVREQSEQIIPLVAASSVVQLKKNLHIFAG